MFTSTFPLRVEFVNVGAYNDTDAAPTGLGFLSIAFL